ncbi:hypothetical protein C1H46_004087 [Malus baccata]|uniref:Uncharacterized protein n=1 Tax=Malus baccata TaxID=106549 RepID=A0A540NGS5_MALBA|nr:hypothetical protein C1H46_004087 [Malus baccata]
MRRGAHRRAGGKRAKTERDEMEWVKNGVKNGPHIQWQKSLSPTPYFSHLSLQRTKSHKTLKGLNATHNSPISLSLRGTEIPERSRSH